MKKLCALILFTFTVANAHAQLSLTKTNNAPIAGYSFTEKNYDSVSAIPKTTGLNQNWNFTGMNYVGYSTPQTFSTAAASPSASSFPGANLSIASGTPYFSFYNSQTNSLEYLGDEDVSTGDKFIYSNTFVWMTWPFTYGDTNLDTYSGSSTGTSTPYSISGTITISGTGNGTVTLPSGTTFTNCLQIVRTYTDDITLPSYSYSRYITSYEYWSGSYRNPIFEVQYMKTVVGTITAVGFTLRSNGAADVGLKENKLDEQKLIVFPNPVKDKLNIILPDNATAEEIELYDVSGKLVATNKNSNSLDTHSLPKGVYTLIVKHNNLRSKEQIIIME